MRYTTGYLGIGQDFCQSAGKFATGKFLLEQANLREISLYHTFLQTGKFAKKIPSGACVLAPEAYVWRPADVSSRRHDPECSHAPLQQPQSRLIVQLCASR